MSRVLVLFIFIANALCAGCHQPVSESTDILEPGNPNDEPVVDSSSSGPGIEKGAAEIESNTIESMNDLNLPATSGFRQNVAQNLSRNRLSISGVANESSPVEKRIFSEYGAVFLTKAVPPSKAMFENESEVAAFQASAGISRETMYGETIELQPLAMESLKAARVAANARGLEISPRDGAEAGRRSFEKTLLLWKSRFEPALEHWKSEGRLSDDQISNLSSLPVREQVAEVLELEKEGIFFNTFFNDSILYSVAAPGTSQHLSMLAFDVTEYSDLAVQEILGDHGWFRTVQNDAPHFTFLGYEESELTGLGLEKVNKEDGDFWIPAL